jgi:hypothetical protein
MSNSEEPGIAKWFRENYPVEDFLVKEINRRVQAIYSNVQMEQDILPIDLFQVKSPDGFSVLQMRDNAPIFYGALAKAIIDTVFKMIEAKTPQQNLNQELEDQARKVMKEYIEKHSPIILQNFKRCPKCQLDNDYGNKFCKECGTKLPEKQPNSSKIYPTVLRHMYRFNDQYYDFSNKRCYICGHVNEWNAKYCVVCGYKLVIR